ncbi:MAG: ImmA/IrrE family metallo-endopeptidase [Candidatus Acidiferrales bacterium]
MRLAKSQILSERPDMAEVPVNGKVLQWAREIRGLDVGAAAELLDIPADELLAYESGTKKPLVGFLRRMSAKYRINFTSLLMPEPLPVTKLPTDHRARFGKPRLSIDTLVAIEEINEALDVFGELSEEIRGLVPKLNIGQADIKENPAVVAARERKRLGVSLKQQREWKGLGHARVEWRKRIEKLGVFTYMIPMPPDELSGFSLLRDDVAAICVNDKEPTEGAKIFTLFHEYGHLLLRNTGISDENNQSRVERFCNHFSASFLIPRANLLEAISERVEDFKAPYDFSDADVKHLAASFRVSNRAIALRLERTGFAPDGFYGRRTAPWDVPTASKVVTSKSQPSAIKIRIKRIGRLHASTVLEAVRRHAINSFDASELIGLQPGSFKKVEAALE